MKKVYILYILLISQCASKTHATIPSLKNLVLHNILKNIHAYPIDKLQTLPSDLIDDLISHPLLSTLLPSVYLPKNSINILAGVTYCTTKYFSYKTPKKNKEITLWHEMFNPWVTELTISGKNNIFERFGGPSVITAVAIDPHENRLAYGTVLGNISIVDLITLEEHTPICFYHFKAINALQFNAHGAFLLSSDEDKNVGLWRIKDNKLVARIAPEAIHLEHDGIFSHCSGNGFIAFSTQAFKFIRHNEIPQKFLSNIFSVGEQKVLLHLLWLIKRKKALDHYCSKEIDLFLHYMNHSTLEPLVKKAFEDYVYVLKTRQVSKKTIFSLENLLRYFTRKPRIYHNES